MLTESDYFLKAISIVMGVCDIIKVFSKLCGLYMEEANVKAGTPVRKLL